MSIRLRLPIAAILAVTLLAPAIAFADYFNFGSWSGYGHNNNYNNNYHNGYRNNWQNNGYWGGYGSNFYGQGRNCHPVKQKVRDNYGNRILIQSIQCFDRNGYAYIVPGSSQILRWR